MKKILLIALSIFSLNSLAASNGTVAGYIDSIQIKESGYLLINFKTDHANQTECEQNRSIVIAPNSAVFDKIFSIALAAHATQKKATFYTTLPCYQAYSTSYPVGITAAILGQ